MRRFACLLQTKVPYVRKIDEATVRALTVGSLFSGIGGIDLGFRWAGFETRWFCEIDPFCQRVLAKHWPGVPCYEDIRTVDWETIERPDIIVGGFPCQPVSVAGRKRGQDDERWMWPEYARAVRNLRPRFIVVENVTGLLVRGMGDVLRDLAALGYDAEWQCLPASSVGAPHERERIFLVAYPGGVVGGYGILAHAGDALSRDTQWRAAQGVATGRGWKRWLGAAARALDGDVSARDFRGMDDGLPEGLDASRFHALGNAVVPQCAEVIARAIMAAAGKT